MTVAVQLEPAASVPSVEYRWDADTDILTARLQGPAGARACRARWSLRARMARGSSSTSRRGASTAWRSRSGPTCTSVAGSRPPAAEERASSCRPTRRRPRDRRGRGGDAAARRGGRHAARDPLPTRRAATRAHRAARARSAARRRSAEPHRRTLAAQRAALSHATLHVITTIVLIRAEPASVPATAQRLAEIDGVTEVYSVSGDWDLVAIVKVAEYDQIAQRRDGDLSHGARAAAHADAHGVSRVLQEGSSAGLGHRRGVSVAQCALAQLRPSSSGRRTSSSRRAPSRPTCRRRSGGRAGSSRRRSPTPRGAARRRRRR